MSGAKRPGTRRALDWSARSLDSSRPKDMLSSPGFLGSTVLGTMRSPTEKQVQAAERLLQQASGNTGAAAERAEAAGRVYETLFSSLAPVIGPAGVRALFSRSVKLTKTEFPSLEMGVAVESPDGNVQLLKQLRSCLSMLEPATATKAATRLYATLLELLANFIGEQLVQQIVKSAFEATDDAGTKEKG